MRLAVISPFLDRRHGTERVIIEQLERLSARPDMEVHLYAQRVADFAAVSPFEVVSDKPPSTRIVWHKVPALPGPHLFGFIWWFAANQFCRWRDARFRGLRHDLVYSPGINAWDADAIAVHIVFHEFHRRVGTGLKLSGSPLASWPRKIHRRLYYQLIMVLERKIYANPKASLVAVSQLVARHMDEFFNRADITVIPNAVNTAMFTQEIRSQRRSQARGHFGLSQEDFALLLVGNDWEKKGLTTLLRSLAECRELPFCLLVVGKDDCNLFSPLIAQLGLQSRVHFYESTGDVVQFYAAADLYAGPSLEDSFALPPLEAMACGLPVITSVNNGGSQAITDGVDGFVLQNPRDSSVLAALLRQLYKQPELRKQMGENAARTASAYTWDRNAAQTMEFLEAALRKKRRS